MFFSNTQFEYLIKPRRCIKNLILYTNQRIFIRDSDEELKKSGELAITSNSSTNRQDQIVLNETIPKVQITIVNPC